MVPISRRRFMHLSLLAAGSTLTGCAAPGARHRRSLKDIVKTPTVDLEVHVSDVELYVNRDVPDVVPVTDEELLPFMERMRWEVDAPGYAENRERFREYRSLTSIDGRARFLMDELDEAGIDIAVHQAVDHSVKASAIGRHFEAPFERILIDAVRVREAYPGRVIQMIGIDPRSGAADAVRRFEIAVEDYGFKGLGEVVLQQFETYPHDRSMYPLYEKCVEYGLPFVGNCEGPAPYTMPAEFEPVARDFPDLKICLAGAGRPRNPSQSRAPIDEAIRVAAEYENVYLDTADWQRRDADGIGLFLSFLRRCFDSNARGKVMYGSDFPVLTAMYHPRDWIDVLINQAGDYGYSFTDQEISMFYSTNALKFLEDVL